MRISFPRFPASPIAEVLRECARLGIRLSAAGPALKWHADKDPPPAFLDSLQALKPELLELLQPIAEPPAAPSTPWTDDGAWLARIVPYKDPRCDEVLALLFSWVVAAGGRIDGEIARLPPLNYGLAAVELRRLLKRSGLEVREGVEISADLCRYCHEVVTWTGPGGVAFADGSFSHVTCFDEAETLRQAGAATFDPNNL